MPVSPELKFLSHSKHCLRIFDLISLYCFLILEPLALPSQLYFLIPSADRLLNFPEPRPRLSAQTSQGERSGEAAAEARS